MDISDGLVEDLSKMMLASGLAAQIDSWKVPLHPMLVKVFPDHALRLALAGGEEYELLYTASEPVMARTLGQIAGATVIGRVVDGPSGQVLVQDRDGNPLPGLEAGWDHFRS